MSPKFQTQERGEFKQRFLSMLEPDSAEKEDKTLFKARELNRKILTSVGKLPDVELKQLTTFDEFQLSKTNNMNQDFDKENPQFSPFKARQVDRKILQEATFKPQINNQKIETKPFDFQTEKRCGKMPKLQLTQSCSGFKANPMPSYKFFEIDGKKSAKKNLTKSKEFKLSQSCKKKVSFEESGENHHQFKARAVPDF